MNEPSSKDARASVPERTVPGSLTPLRLSDEQREATVAALSDAFARDVLTLEQFEERLEASYRATTSQALAELTADLPAHAVAAGASTSLVTSPLRIKATFASVERAGRMQVPPRLEVRATFGNVELDLSSAVFAQDVTEISIRSVFGNVEILLPPDSVVENHGSGFFGNFEGQLAAGHQGDPASPGPRIRIVGKAILGNVEITTTRQT